MYVPEIKITDEMVANQKNKILKNLDFKNLVLN